MNHDHLKALLTRQTHLFSCDFEGIRLSSDGTILVASDLVPLSHDPKDASLQVKMRELWQNWQTADFPEIEPSASHWGHTQSDIRYFRRIGATAVNEAYFRTLHEPGAHWYWSGSPNEPLIVRVNGAVIAGVMGIRLDRGGDGAQLPEAPSDDLVFEQFADAGNGYYLQGDKVLLKEITQLEKDLASANDKLDDLQAEVDDIEAELAEKRAELHRRKQALSKAS